MNWQLQPADEATAPQPGGSSFDEFIRRNVVMAKVEDMVAWGQSKKDWEYFDRIMAPIRHVPLLPALGNHDYFFFKNPKSAF